MPHVSITAATTPHKAAIIMASTGAITTYEELDRHSNQVAQALRTLGVHAGDHIALMMENSAHFLEICWGAYRSGVIFTPISTHLKADEIAYILDNSEAKVLILGHSLAAVAEGLPSERMGQLRRYMVDGIAEGYASWEELIYQMPDTAIDDQQKGSAMLYSSGTTGKPKGILTTPADTAFDSPHALSPTFGAAFGFGEETVYLSPAPLYHAAPLHYCMMTHDLAGTVVVMEKFETQASLAAIEAYRVTHSQWVPIMFVRMLKLPPEVRASYDLSSHRFAVHAAAPCPIEVKEQMIEWWGPIIYEYYAASESIGATLISSPQWLSHKGSVGLPIVGKIRILDDDGIECATGDVGTVYFEATGQLGSMFEYYKEPEKTAEAYLSNNLATTGDVGYVDAEGYLYLTDRKHFTIISGGVNIYPQEIENLLINHPAIADVAVFGIPCDEFGERVHAVVEPQNWVDATDEVAIELVEWLRERVSNIKVPRTIDFMQKLPRMDNGKLYKRHLVDAYKTAARDESRAD
jgi:long-chain acyl-CoA synthetase